MFLVPILKSQENLYSNLGRHNLIYFLTRNRGQTDTSGWSLACRSSSSTSTLTSCGIRNKLGGITPDRINALKQPICVIVRHALSRNFPSVKWKTFQESMFACFNIMMHWRRELANIKEIRGKHVHSHAYCTTHLQITVSA